MGRRIIVTTWEMKAVRPHLECSQLPTVAGGAWKGKRGEAKGVAVLYLPNSSHQLIYFFKQSPILFKETSDIDNMSENCEAW